MRDAESPPATGGPDTDLLRQEVEFILAQATKEPWVIEEARRIEEARAVKGVWERALGSVS